MEMPTPGRYQHYKGDFYILLFVASNSTNDAGGEFYAVYYSLETGGHHVRKLSEFTELVPWPDGEMRPRFVRVGAVE